LSFGEFFVTVHFRLLSSGTHGNIVETGWSNLLFFFVSFFVRKVRI
jgi:hypothetical protein